jgi:hypothetical protein
MTESCQRAPPTDLGVPPFVRTHAVFDKSGGAGHGDIVDICKGVQERAPSLSRREITTCVHSICERYGEKKRRRSGVCANFTSETPSCWS